jgi:hypothetical protein
VGDCDCARACFSLQYPRVSRAATGDLLVCLRLTSRLPGRVRALGETDLNPVSAIGKISQLLFAIVQVGLPLLSSQSPC